MADGMFDGLFGSLTPEQTQQMYALALMQGGMGGSMAPQQSGYGAMAQGLSPILRAMMLRQMMRPQQVTGPVGGGASMGAPGAVGTAPWLGDQTGPIGGNAPVVSPLAIPPRPVGPLAGGANVNQPGYVDSGVFNAPLNYGYL